MKYLTVLLLIGSAHVTWAEPLLQEDFQTDRSSLEEAGWSLPIGAQLVEDAERAGTVLQVNVEDAESFDRRYAHKYVPIEPGQVYTAQVQMRSEDVGPSEGLSRNRGAVLFLQFADEDFGHLRGGSFPSGLQGTQREWVPQRIEYTRPAPDNARFIQVLLGIEGEGTAWFDSLELRESVNLGMADFEPTGGGGVDQWRPTLNWQVQESFDQYLIELSQSEAFEEERTTYFYVDGPGVRPPKALEPGYWHWRVRPKSHDFDGFLAASETQTFRVEEDASRWPPHVEPLTARWHEDARPLLTAVVQPMSEELEIQISIAGEPATIEHVDGDRIRFHPGTALEPGVHDVEVRVSNQEGDSVVGEGFVKNAEPGTRTTIDEDRMLRVDGERFFPLGAYRDPSDSLTDMSGLVEAGFNLTHDYDFDHGRVSLEEARAYLELAEEHDIKAFLGLARNRLRDRQYIQRWVAELMDQPALLNWYLYDEPEMHGVKLRAMESLQSWVRETDPFTPTSIVVNWQHEYERYGQVADIFYQMAYVLEIDEPLDATGVEDDLHSARRELRDDQPMWAVLQVHTPRFRDYRRSLSSALEQYGQPMRPTYEESRVMAFMALASDVEGLIWYWGPRDWYDKREHSPQVWAGMVRLVNELNDLQPYLVAEANENDHPTINEPARVWTRQTNGRRILALINPKPEHIEAAVDLRAFEVSTIYNRDTGEPITLNGRSLEASLGPHEVRLFEWEVAE